MVLCGKLYLAHGKGEEHWRIKSMSLWLKARGRITLFFINNQRLDSKGIMSKKYSKRMGIRSQNMKI
jgi:hypothetical protein